MAKNPVSLLHKHKNIAFGSEDRWYRECMMWRARFLMTKSSQNIEAKTKFMSLPSGSFSGGTYTGEIFLDEPQNPPYYEDTPENHFERIIDETEQTRCSR